MNTLKITLFIAMAFLLTACSQHQYWQNCTKSKRSNLAGNQYVKFDQPNQSDDNNHLAFQQKMHRDTVAQRNMAIIEQTQRDAMNAYATTTLGHPVISGKK